MALSDWCVRTCNASLQWFAVALHLVHRHLSQSRGGSCSRRACCTANRHMGIVFSECQKLSAVNNSVGSMLRTHFVFYVCCFADDGLIYVPILNDRFLVLLSDAGVLVSLEASSDLCNTPPHPPPVWLICTLIKFSMHSEQVFVRPLLPTQRFVNARSSVSQPSLSNDCGGFSGLRGCECAIA